MQEDWIIPQIVHPVVLCLELWQFVRWEELGRDVLVLTWHRLELSFTNSIKNG